MSGVIGMKKGILKEDVRIFKHPEGYLYIKVRNNKTDKRYKLHKLILEYKIGRKLAKNEVTHHINNNKQDNRLENLEVRIKGNHQSEHRKSQKDFSKTTCSKCGNKKGYLAKRCNYCYSKERNERIKSKRNKLGRFI